MSIGKNVKDACNKIRNTFLSLVNCGIYQDGLNPLTSKRIYNSVVLPKALYGCELWSNLHPNHIMSLERAHRFCIKFIIKALSDAKQAEIIEAFKSTSRYLDDL